LQRDDGILGRDELTEAQGQAKRDSDCGEMPPAGCWFINTPAFHHDYTRFFGEYYRRNGKNCPTDGRCP
jgi:hypothetical protein